ncbi:hypothetical protein V500_09395 [Pseudogymnoascus sp. VKM F-4518 (FW-2643)]|nr:hypothetical protein V500_09395 [Pseudogymnoascus sp. VKM F-4518 (FW-2643)]
MPPYRREIQQLQTHRNNDPRDHNPRPRRPHALRLAIACDGEIRPHRILQAPRGDVRSHVIRVVPLVVLQAVEDVGAGAEVVQFLRQPEVSGVEDGAGDPADHADIGEVDVVFAQRVGFWDELADLVEALVVGGIVEEGEDDGEGLLHAEDAVEGPFAVELDDGEGRVRRDAHVGDYVLAGVVAFGGAGPEEQPVEESWSRGQLGKSSPGAPNIPTEESPFLQFSALQTWRLRIPSQYPYLPLRSPTMATDLKTLAPSEAHYFNSYNHHGIHEEMLKDEVRTRSYMNAIVQNKHLFKDKVVLDVGCGTGILSMFAAKAGAKHVIGVDMSTIIGKAKEIVEVNGLTDKITLLQGKMEDVVLPFDKVDIIISEWMGYFLLYESMLDTVLWARDKYLVPNGLIFPDKATIFMAGIEDGEYKDEKIGFWDNVYGFDYSPLKKTALTEPLVDTVEIKAVVTDPTAVLTLDLYTCTVADLAFTSPFVLEARRDDFVHALIAWFDIDFTACHKAIRFSTGPHTKYTHWKQTVFYLREVLTVQQGEKIEGVLTNKPNEQNPRDLDVKISYKLETEDVTRKAEGACEYKMC